MVCLNEKTIDRIVRMANEDIGSRCKEQNAIQPYKVRAVLKAFFKILLEDRK